MSLSKDEKERLVIDLYKKGKTRAEIAHATNLTFKTIQTIIAQYEDSLPSRLPSKSSQALTMFKDGLDPLSVAIQLNLPAETAESYYLDFKRLNGLFNFGKIYTDIKESLTDFIAFYNEVKSRDITVDNVKQAISVSIRLPRIQYDHAKLSYELQQMQYSLPHARQELQQLNDQLPLLRGATISENSKLQSVCQQVERMSEKYTRLVQTIGWLKGNKDYQDGKQIIESVVGDVVKNNNLIIGFAIGAVLSALENHATPDSRPYVSGFTDELINTVNKSASLMFDEILTYIHGRIIEHTFAELGKTNPVPASEYSLEITETEESLLEMVLKNRKLSEHEIERS
jgi:hypothetical protein